jgi:FAD dependent monooxygenase
MWDYASTHFPSLIPSSDKTALFSEFSGLVGVSPQEEAFDLSPAESNVTFGHGNTRLLFTQSGSAYWLLIFKDEYSCPVKRSKHTEEELKAVVEKYKDVAMTEKIKFGDLWKTNTRHVLLSFEEGVLSKWHAGRIVLVGDSAHKVLPSFPVTPIHNRLSHTTKPTGVQTARYSRPIIRRALEQKLSFVYTRRLYTTAVC